MQPPPNRAAYARVVLLMSLLSVLAGAIRAQALPDINRLEVEKARLIILDSKDKRQGVLEFAKARKLADGRVRIDDAKLTLEAEEGAFELQAKKFNYAPDTGAFECPLGANVVLPDDGEFTIPPVTGTITLGDTKKMRMQATGEAKITTELLTAEMTDPTFTLSLQPAVVHDAKGKEKSVLMIGNLLVHSPHGARMSVRLERLPSLQGGPEAGGVVSLTCFGDASLTILDTQREKGAPIARRATLSMLRRASMILLREAQTFSVTSGYLEIRGNVVRVRQAADESEKEPKESEKKPKERTSLTDVELDARQNVRMELKNTPGPQAHGRDFQGSGDVLRYREFPTRTELRLETNAALDLDRGDAPDGARLSLHLEAAQFVDVVAPQISGTVQQATMELFDRARVQRLRDGSPDWQVTGRQVRLFLWQDSEGSYSHSFDAVAEGFSPLLRVFSVPAPGDAEFEITRAAVYGARAEGTLVGDQSQTRVDGPDVLAVVTSNFPLADAIRRGLGLGGRGKLTRRDGRMSVRASEMLELGLKTGEGSAGDFQVAARGGVALDYEPQPRDDPNKVTMTGDFASIELRGGELHAADLAGKDALATLGYDLLTGQGLILRENAGTMVTHVTGPGRLVARDAHSVRYFRESLSSLPRSNPDDRDLPDPDAGWLDFTHDCHSVRRRVEHESETRMLEIGGPTAHLVYGDFEMARAGRAAVNDLAELTLPEVRVLYFVSGARAVLLSSRSLKPGDNAPAVNVLRLEADAVVRSELDGVYAAASEAIEITGASEQAGGQNPFTAVLLGRSQLRIEHAGEFFGEHVRGGAFAYDGQWILNASDRLEITLRPIDAGLPATGLKPVYRALANALSERWPTLLRVAAADQALRALRSAIGEVTAGERPAAEVAQPRRALLALEDARRRLACAAALHPHDVMRKWHVKGAEASLRMADRLLGVLVDVAGRGGMNGEFHSSNEKTPRLDLATQNLLVTFNQLGEVTALEAEGPVELRRSDYAVQGNSLKRGPDGTILLDGAMLTLPESTGVQVRGMRSISMRFTERGVASDGTHVAPRMVTRVTGVGMKVHIKMAEQP
jgi:hypothetical protein